MKTQHTIQVTADAKNPDSCVTAGIARIPAPTYKQTTPNSNTPAERLPQTPLIRDGDTATLAVQHSPSCQQQETRHSINSLHKPHVQSISEPFHPKVKTKKHQTHQIMWSNQVPSSEWLDWGLRRAAQTWAPPRFAPPPPLLFARNNRNPSN